MTIEVFPTHTAYVEANTGEIKLVQLTQGINPVEGLQEDGVTYVVPVYETELTPDELIEFYYYDIATSKFISRPARPNPYAYWNGVAWDWNYELFLGAIRAERDQRLYASDWTQMPDVALSAEQVAAYVSYRQALRDITTAIISDPANYSSLDSVNWPEKPSS